MLLWMAENTYVWSDIVHGCNGQTAAATTAPATAATAMTMAHYAVVLLLLFAGRWDWLRFHFHVQWRRWRRRCTIRNGQMRQATAKAKPKRHEVSQIGSCWSYDREYILPRVLNVTECLVIPRWWQAHHVRRAHRKVLRLKRSKRRICW